MGGEGLRGFGRKRIEQRGKSYLTARNVQVSSQQDTSSSIET